jgi:hypothetical protein
MKSRQTKPKWRLNYKRCGREIGPFKDGYLFYLSEWILILDCPRVIFPRQRTEFN